LVGLAELEAGRARGIATTLDGAKVRAIVAHADNSRLKGTQKC